MTTAILEILGLLIVSCLIGVYFTYRYWKSKMETLKGEKDELVSKNSQLQAEIDKLKKSNDQLIKEKEEVVTEKTALSSEVAKLKTENEKLTKEKAGLENDNAKLKAETTSQKEEMANQKKQLKSTKEKPAPKPENSKKIKELEDKIELMDEQLGEKERELEAVILELKAKSISYYKQIDGKRYKAATILMADKSVEGKGDGRISMEDAKMIFDTISDGNAYTQVEKDTLHYIRDNYKWTDSADELFRTKVRSWAAKGHQLED